MAPLAVAGSSSERARQAPDDKMFAIMCRCTERLHLHALQKVMAEGCRVSQVRGLRSPPASIAGLPVRRVDSCIVAQCVSIFQHGICHTSDCQKPLPPALLALFPDLLLDSFSAFSSSRRAST